MESQRIAGQPRQRTIAYLGSIIRESVTVHGHRDGFWKKADEALAKLNLTAQVRSAIEDKLATVVARPTEASRAEALARLEKLVGFVNPQSNTA